SADEAEGSQPASHAADLTIPRRVVQPPLSSTIANTSGLRSTAARNGENRIRNPRSHPTALVAAHIRPDNRSDAPTLFRQRRSPTASCQSNPIGVIAGSGYIVRKLSLFPSRFARRGPHPQMGPRVRIRFPPAASLVR